MTDEEEIQKLLRFQASQAALSFLHEKLDAGYEPPKTPEIILDETSSDPIKLDLLGLS